MLREKLFIQILFSALLLLLLPLLMLLLLLCLVFGFCWFPFHGFRSTHSFARLPACVSVLAQSARLVACLFYVWLAGLVGICVHVNVCVRVCLFKPCFEFPPLSHAYIHVISELACLLE